MASTVESDKRVFRTLILYPNPGKEVELQHLFASVVAQAEEDSNNGVIQILLYNVVPIPGMPVTEDEKTPRIIGHAIYKDAESSITSHQTSYFDEFNETAIKKELLARPWEVINCKLFAGFQRESIEVAK